MNVLKSCLIFFFSLLFCNVVVAQQNNNYNKNRNIGANENRVSTIVNDGKNVKNSNSSNVIANNENVKNKVDSNKHGVSNNTVNNGSKKNDNKNVKKENFHIVQNGENVYRIALKYKVSQNDLLKVNNLKNSNIFVGQKLLLPENSVVENENSNNNINSNANRDVKDGSNDSKNVVNENEYQNQNLNKVENVQDRQMVLINKIDSTTFIWPSRGTIIGKFGSPTKTGKLEGVYIGCENGTVVRATSSGIISYSDKIVGYGNVILISHYNGFISAYGSVDPLVSVGDRVKKGQVIAHIQKTPNSKRSQLYFSIRKDNKSYNPEKVIQTKISN